MVAIKVSGLLQKLIFLLILWILVVACHPMAEVTIQVIEPGEVTIPPYINEVAFINRSYVPSLVNPDSVTWTNEELYILDTIINYRIFKGLRDALDQSPLFELEELSIIQERQYDTANFLSPLNQKQLNRISRLQDSDALISMEYYKIYGDRLKGFSGIDFTAILHFNSSTYWRIYDLVRDTIIDEYMHRDSVIWQEFGESSEEALGKLPLITDALREAGYHAGYTYGTRISPIWIEESRYYHINGSRKMREAAWLADSGKWNEAAGIWRKVAYEENYKLAAKACLNMALVCEMEDLFEPALEWAAKSYLIREKSLTKEYIELLEK